MVRLSRVSYTNHLGGCFEFGGATGTFLAEGTDLHGYSRDHGDGSGYRATVPDSREYTLAVVFDGTVERSFNDLHEVVDVDAEAGVAGLLRVEDWEVECAAVEFTADVTYPVHMQATATLTLLSRNPVWQRHVVKLFDPGDTRAAIINESFRASPVTLEVEGPADTVNVGIGGNTYEVAATVPEGGRLVVDGLAKTAYVYAADGTAINVLDGRVGEQVQGSGYYLFEPIPSGYSEVTWHPKNGLRVTVHEQRLGMVAR